MNLVYQVLAGRTEKPDAGIFWRACQLAGCSPEEARRPTLNAEPSRNRIHVQLRRRRLQDMRGAKALSPVGISVQQHAGVTSMHRTRVSIVSGMCRRRQCTSATA